MLARFAFCAVAQGAVKKEQGGRSPYFNQPALLGGTICQGQLVNHRPVTKLTGAIVKIHRIHLPISLVIILSNRCARKCRLQ